jgi:hybrid cluster-associated redox disulfide protein
MIGRKTSIDLDMPLSDFMVRWPETIPVFLRFNMLCVGCLIGPFHTVADACSEHGADQATFVAALEQAIRLKRTKC